MTNEKTPILWMVAAAGAVAATTALWHSRRQKQRGKMCIPRNPSGLFESLDNLGSINAHNFLVQESNRLGSLVYRIWLPINSSLYIVGDPYMARAILTDSSTDDRPVSLYKAAVPLSCGLHSMFDSPTGSHHWKAVRKGTVPAFSVKEVDRMKSICEQHVERWIDQVLNPCVSKGGTFDPYHEMTRITFRVICEAAFEYPHVTDDEIATFSASVETAMIEFDGREHSNPLRQYFTFLLPERQRAFAACKVLHDFGFKILNHFYETNQKNPETRIDNQPNTVIRLLVNNPYLTTDRMKVAEMLVFLVAGFDTTGFTLAAALYHQAKNPEVHPKLQESVRALNENDEKGSNSATKNYLQWFLRESDRMLPVAAFGAGRVTGREFVVPRPPIQKSKTSPTDEKQGMIVPKNALVVLSQIVANLSPSVFERPTEFDPCRWANGENTEKVMPFCAGPRACVGQALAKTELATVISILAPRFSFELTEPGRVEYSFTLRMIDTRLKPHKVTTPSAQEY